MSSTNRALLGTGRRESSHLGRRGRAARAGRRDRSVRGSSCAGTTIAC